MGAQHHAHFLQHVLIVVDADVVETDRRIDSPRLEPVERQHAAAQTEIRAAIVADVGVRLGQLVEIAFRQPDRVAERRLRPEQAEALDVVDSAAAMAATPGVLLLIGRFDEMHMDGNAVLLGAVGEHRQPLVGAPLLVRRRQLDLDALLAAVPGVQMLEQRDGLRRRHLKAREILWPEAGRTSSPARG